MAEKDKKPKGSDPDQPPPSTESDDSILDFGVTESVREGASGVIPLADLPDPQSSPSLVSWTEVIRQHRESAQVPGGEPAEPVSIDSMSDKDLLARIAAEEQRKAAMPASESGERDTDKLGKVPMVGGTLPSSSIQLGGDLGTGSQPRSGSAVRFDVTEPPADAAGAMPSPWADAMILEAIPIDDADPDDEDIPMAEPVPYEAGEDELIFAAEMAGAGASGSVVNLHHDSPGDDLLELPAEDEGTPGRRSSILDILVKSDPLVEPDMGRAASDVVDVGGSSKSGLLSHLEIERERSPEDSAIAAALAEESRDAPTLEAEAWAGDTEGPVLDAVSVDDQTVETGGVEESVDLYAEGPVSQGISDSGALEISEAQYDEAERRQRAVESSAIDLSSNPTGSIFDMELAGAAADEDNAIDMSLPASGDASGQSSMIRHDQMDIEEQAAAQLNKKKAAPRQAPPPAVPRARQTKEPAAVPPTEAEYVVENEAPFEEPPEPRKTPQKAARVEKAAPPAKKRGGLLLGAFLGILLATGGIGAAWYLKQLPSPDSVFGDGGTAKTDNKDKGSGDNADVAKAKKEAEDAKKAADDMVASISKQLKDAGIEETKPEDGLKKVLANKSDVDAKLKEVADALKAANIEDPDLSKAIATLATARIEADKDLKAVADVVKPRKDQKVAEAIQEIITARTKAETDQKNAEMAVLKQLKDAGIDDPKVEDGIKKLLASKNDAETKIKNAAVALDKAGIKDPDFAKSLAMLITAKEGSEATARGIRERLEKAKIVAADADQAALLKAVEEAITRGSADAVVKLAAEKKAAEDRAATLDSDLKKSKKETEAITTKAKDDLAAQKTAYEAKLADVRTPAQVVDVWLPALADKEKQANAAAAIADADLVLANAASTNADKAKALAVRALALRNQGKLTEARAAFEAARKHPGHAKDDLWAKEVAKAADALENPAAFVGAAPTTVQPTQQQLLERVESGLKLFEGEKFAKDRARLVAQRSLIKLDANDLAGAFADADEAVKAGAGPDGHFALARVLEAQGKFNEAENAYRDVLRGQSEASPLYRQAALGLARVLLNKRKAAPMPATTSMIEPDALHAQLVLLLTLAVDVDAKTLAEIEEAIRLADALIAAKEYHGYIIKADALAKLGRYNDALSAYSTGIKSLKVLPREYDGVLDRILAQHPALQRPDPNLQADPSRSLKHYAQGLEYFRSHQYSRAEEQFVAAIKNWNRDARYMYYLGLARLAKGERKVAEEDFKAGAVLEMRGLPLPKVITEAFERVQGDERAVVEAFRP